MAKSLRNKAKTAARSRKREEGEYQVHHAARLARLSEKLLKTNSNKDQIAEGSTAADAEGEDGEETMEVTKDGDAAEGGQSRAVPLAIRLAQGRTDARPLPTPSWKQPRRPRRSRPRAHATRAVRSGGRPRA